MKVAASPQMYGAMHEGRRIAGFPFGISKHRALRRE